MVDYASNAVPEGYKCQVCGATGIKLWRLYMSTWINLLCASCAAKDQEEDISGMNLNGRHISDLYISARPTDKIGSYIPAVPTEEGYYWGYTSVPDRAVEWWARLPNS